MNKLMTIAEVAKELNIPESTARYYRDNFIDFIPSVGEGRKKRYRPETVEVLRFIADGFKGKLTTIEIESGLSRMFPRNLNDYKLTEIGTAATQQRSENELQLALEQMGKAVQIIADQKEEIAELRKQIANIEKIQQEQQKYINNNIEEQNQVLLESIKEIQEVKNEIASTQINKKKGIFSRFFK